MARVASSLLMWIYVDGEQPYTPTLWGRFRVYLTGRSAIGGRSLKPFFASPWTSWSIKETCLYMQFISTPNQWLPRAGEGLEPICGRVVLQTSLIAPGLRLLPWLQFTRT